MNGGVGNITVSFSKYFFLRKKADFMNNKRLYKSSANYMLCGVCGGIAEYFDIDPTLVRLAWVILTCFGGAGIWAYIIAAIVIPKG